MHRAYKDSIIRH